MRWLRNFGRLRYLLVVLAALIAAVSLLVSNVIVNDLKAEEERRVVVWASAVSSLINAGEGEDVSLEGEILASNKTIPVMLCDEQGAIEIYNNIPQSRLDKRADEMRKSGQKMSVPIGDGREKTVYYDDSDTLVKLSYYPYIQLGVVVLFFVICFVAILNSKRAEQNRVWVGLSKETAHQLGTPISSLMAWVEVLRSKYPDDELMPEMEHDVQRLQMIAERFSKIGSKAEPLPEDINLVIDRAVAYMKRRSPAMVSYDVHLTASPLVVPVNVQLLEWVVENLCKNAIDAMGGRGSIEVYVTDSNERVAIEVSDTGKGIARSLWKRVFDPGYTTKPRGWGLGLSLAKRIVEDFHNGSIFIRKSVMGKGTTFRIELKK